MKKPLASLACVVAAIFGISGCADPAAENEARAAEQRRIEAANRAHREKIAKLRVTNPELFEESDPAKRPQVHRPVQRQTQFCDTAGAGILTGYGLRVCGDGKGAPKPAPPTSP